MTTTTLSLIQFSISHWNKRIIDCIPPILLLMLDAFLGWPIGGNYGVFWGSAAGVIIGAILMIIIVFSLIKARGR
ncbi:hypothetical protein HED51_05195 [Ochrobactrum grignonense]|nr:hypothetical protein [Brucella grignonensis]